ncbi:hypothetical protein HYDPIDRAFT_81314, partial [Hydnomerulius pinastri MD-312]
YLDELIRLEGRGDAVDSVCVQCRELPALIRCDDCFGQAMYCERCVVGQHVKTPLHRVKKWNGSYFECVTLKALGLRIQLGHPPGQRCVNPRRAFNDDFVVMDSLGIHEVSLDFCSCETAKDHVTQLLRMRWFPATPTDPRSAATFRVLEAYQLLSFESKASALEFYQSLARLTNNTGLPPPERYEAFLRMVREWRDLKMLKRSGRGHDPAGIEKTSDGACAVLCPACPHPGKNLPEGWENVPDCYKWLYALFVAIDANFRLKRKAVSSDEADPCLSQGWAYFIERSAYKLHLQSSADTPQPKSSCSSHNAVNMADTKSDRGLAATGVGTVDCARHNMKLPNGVGDLQKGEKYVNMDYLFFSAMRLLAVNVLNVSYDIACQWYKHLWERMSKLPSPLQLRYRKMLISFFVPKFHLPAHIASCQTRYSFNFTPHVGRTDGEAPERGWANINPVASSTKEMGPGSRQDTLNDHFGDWNWKKVVALGETMLRKLKEAIPERRDHQRTLQELEDAVNEDDASVLAAWRTEIQTWELTRGEPNPFESRINAPTQASVRLQLAKDDAKVLEQSSQPALHEEISPSVLISAGLDLEELQRRLHVEREALGQHATDLQEANLLLRSNGLQRKIDSWVNAQLLYMPNVATLRANKSYISSLPEDFKLWFPSEVGLSVSCDTILRSHEWQLRHAQAHDALSALRQSLRCRSYMYKYKDSNLRGQGANTRARNLLKKVDAKISAAATRYRIAYGALLALGPLLGKNNWQLELQPLRTLKAEDIRAMTDLMDGETQGKKSLSWIWKMRGATSAGNDDEDKESAQEVRIEWCKARARARRWAEEVELLREEMRRVLAFFEWHTAWWDEQGENSPQIADTTNEGYIAYAKRQVALRRSLSQRFSSNWSDTLAYAKLCDTDAGYGASEDVAMDERSGV